MSPTVKYARATIRSAHRPTWTIPAGVRPNAGPAQEAEPGNPLEKRFGYNESLAP